MKTRWPKSTPQRCWILGSDYSEGVDFYSFYNSKKPNQALTVLQLQVSGLYSETLVRICYRFYSNSSFTGSYTANAPHEQVADLTFSVKWVFFFFFLLHIYERCLQSQCFVTGGVKAVTFSRTSSLGNCCGVRGITHTGTCWHFNTQRFTVTQSITYIEENGNEALRVSCVPCEWIIRHQKHFR